LRFILTDRERQLIAPVLEKARRLSAAHQEAVEELLRLLSMASGIPLERLDFNPETFVISDRGDPES
jgi:hypothetical protein